MCEFAFLRQFLIPSLIFNYQRRFICNKPPEKDIGDSVLKTEVYFKKSEGIDGAGA